MTAPDDGVRKGVPAQALYISLGALVVPAGAALLVPDILGEQGVLIWLLALTPAFLLAYYKGWRGAALALAAGMATLSITQVIALLMGLTIPDGLFGVVVAYIVITLCIGWLAEVLLRDKKRMEGMAFEDGLTHLPNRRHARVFLENEFAAAQRGRLLCVVLFDLDNFKEYNDSYGHPAGDEALKAFADILAKTTRRMNLSARFGGEEFLSILAGSGLDGAVAFAERVRATLTAQKLGNGPLTVCAGVALHHPSMGTPDELLAAADHALYRAKREGRNTVRLFGTTLLDPVSGEAPMLEAEGVEPDRFVADRAEQRSATAGDGKDDVRSHVEEGALALVRAAEAKDPSTVGHGETVGAMAIKLAKTLDPEGAMLDPQAVRLGGLVHDIGKISLSEALLNKEGPLDEDEWADMRTHPTVGRQLLAPLLRDATVDAAVTWHHERWDGGGYPDGLAGDAIPLAARIIAIADALAAMTSPRAFRNAFSFDAAVEEVRASFGTRYDPGLKDVFEDALPGLRKVKARSASADDA